jgi:hypothetical protein
MTRAKKVIAVRPRPWQSRRGHKHRDRSLLRPFGTFPAGSWLEGGAPATLAPFTMADSSAQP